MYIYNILPHSPIPMIYILTNRPDLVGTVPNISALSRCPAFACSYHAFSGLSTVTIWPWNSQFGETLLTVSRQQVHDNQCYSSQCHNGKWASCSTSPAANGTRRASSHTISFTAEEVLSLLRIDFLWILLHIRMDFVTYNNTDSAGALDIPVDITILGSVV